MDNKHLKHGDLFAILPKAEQSHELLNLQLLDDADLGRLIDCSYYMLQELDNKAEILKMWEMRLTLLLFNSQLGAAKKEALSLNNCLYGHENQARLRPESKNGQKVVVFPLPNNNDGSIPDLLVRLLLRLKSLPNLNFINEIYKLSYQYRLRSEPSQGLELQAKLMCSAYAAISVLIINKNYVSLLSLLESMRTDLLRVLELDKVYASYLSNINMVWVWAKTLRQNEKTEDLRDCHINEDTLRAVSFVRRTLAGSERELAVDDIVALIVSEKISTRIMCCTLAVWDLQATYETTLTENRLELKVDSGESALDESYSTIMRSWGCNFNKLYGME